MTVIPIVMGVLGTVIKGLVQGLEDLEIRGQMETIQTSVLLRLTRIPGKLRRLAVTQSIVENHHLTLVPKNSQKSKMKLIIIIMIIII